MAEPVPPLGSQRHPVAGDAASCNKKSADNAESIHENIVEETALVIDAAAERALCRKFDFRLLPILAIMVRLTIPFDNEGGTGRAT